MASGIYHATDAGDLSDAELMRKRVPPWLYRSLRPLGETADLLAALEDIVPLTWRAPALPSDAPAGSPTPAPPPAKTPRLAG